MGRNRVVVAVLLEHSVNVATSMLRSIEMAKGGIFSRGANISPNHTDRPDSCRQKLQAEMLMSVPRAQKDILHHHESI